MCLTHRNLGEATGRRETALPRSVTAAITPPAPPLHRLAEAAKSALKPFTRGASGTVPPERKLVTARPAETHVPRGAPPSPEISGISDDTKIAIVGILTRARLVEPQYAGGGKKHDRREWQNGVLMELGRALGQRYTVNSFSGEGKLGAIRFLREKITESLREEAATVMPDFLKIES
jgi:hypothetical protein